MEGMARKIAGIRAITGVITRITAATGATN